MRNKLPEVRAGGGLAAPGRPETLRVSGIADRLAERVLWIHAIALVVAIVVRIGLTAVPWAASWPVNVLSLVNLVLPLIVAEAVFVAARKIPDYRPAAVVGFFLGAIFMMTTPAVAAWAVPGYIGFGLLFWAWKLRRPVLLIGAASAVIASAASEIFRRASGAAPYADYADPNTLPTQLQGLVPGIEAAVAVAVVVALSALAWRTRRTLDRYSS